MQFLPALKFHGTGPSCWTKKEELALYKHTTIYLVETYSIRLSSWHWNSQSARDMDGHIIYYREIEIIKENITA
jgi:hypothetical protein